MTCKQKITAREDLQTVVQKLLHTEFSDGAMIRTNTDTQSTQTASPNKTHSEVFIYNKRRQHSLVYLQALNVNEGIKEGRHQVINFRCHVTYVLLLKWQQVTCPSHPSLGACIHGTPSLPCVMSPNLV